MSRVRDATSSHAVGYASTVMPWIVPHGLQKGSVVRFELTLVESYERWYDVSREFVVGGAGTTTTWRSTSPGA